MIKENEFRIGNWVNVNGKNIKVAGIDTQGINPTWSNTGMDYDFEFYNPYENKLDEINLTDEILLKCGFIFFYCEGSKYHHKNNTYWLQGKEYYFDFEHKTFCKEMSGYHTILERLAENILYLHQLQNIYFALSGKELEVNL